MKKILLTAAVLLMTASLSDVSAQGFLRRLGEAAGNAAKSAVENKVANKAREAVDEAMNGNASNDEAEEPEVTAEPEDTTPETSTTNAKSDFVRGSKVLFQDELKGEQVGEFPSKWDLVEGNCEVAKIGDTFCLSLPPATTEDEGNWSSVRPLMKDMVNYLPDVFTLEFDYFVYKNSDNCNDIKLRLMSSEDDENLWLELGTSSESSKSGDLRYSARKRADSDSKVEGNGSTSLLLMHGITLPSRSTSVPSRSISMAFASSMYLRWLLLTGSTWSLARSI